MRGSQHEAPSSLGVDNCHVEEWYAGHSGEKGQPRIINLTARERRLFLISFIAPQGAKDEPHFRRYGKRFET